MLEAGRRPELRDLAARWDAAYREALASWSATSSTSTSPATCSRAP